MKPCVTCHETKRHEARGMCSRCYSRARREGTLTPLVKGMTMADKIIDEWDHMLMCLGHEGAIRRLADAHKVAESYCAEVLHRAGIVDSRAIFTS